jgi:ABC-2 type transport system permease protein
VSSRKTTAGPAAAGPAGRTTTADLRRQPAGPASLAHRVRAQAGFEATLLLRNGEQLLVSLVLPALALVGLSMSSVPDLGDQPRIDVLAPGVLALATLSTAFTGQAISTGFDRRYGVLRQLATTPLGRGGLLAGKALAVLAVQAVQVFVLGVLALGLGWRPRWDAVPAALVIGLAGTAALVSLALLLAGTLRAEAVLAVANLVWVVLITAGAVVIPAGQLPDAVRPVVTRLPSGALGEGLRAALLGGWLDVGALGVLLAWAVGAAAATLRWFRWSA